MFKILPIKYSNLPFTILDKPEEKTVTEVPLRSFDLSDPFADPIEFSKQTNPTIKTADNVNNIEFIKSDAIYKLKLIIDSVNVENIRKSTPGSKARMVRDLATMLTLLTKIDVLPQFSFSKMDKSLKDSESQQRALEKEKEFSKDNW